ncbi:hypothetical protein [Desulfosporosinus acidiphilus]|uniref:hypothetical protein n=1 Tax=Desulfosporosinus acidiphilus TaxID=885581 RepID=UPI00059B9A10|nr:hypothetical protein [Desulfosporosinus acidiphilus]
MMDFRGGTIRLFFYILRPPCPDALPLMNERLIFQGASISTTNQLLARREADELIVILQLIMHTPAVQPSASGAKQVR